LRDYADPGPFDNDEEGAGGDCLNHRQSRLPEDMAGTEVFKTMMRATARQPNTRINRSMRTMHGMDYIYQLRGMTWVRFRNVHGGRHQPIRDWTFENDLANGYMLPKSRQYALESELNNLSDLAGGGGYNISDADRELISSFYTRRDTALQPTRDRNPLAELADSFRAPSDNDDSSDDDSLFGGGWDGGGYDSSDSGDSDSPGGDHNLRMPNSPSPGIEMDQDVPPTPEPQNNRGNYPRGEASSSLFVQDEPGESSQQHVPIPPASNRDSIPSMPPPSLPPPPPPQPPPPTHPTLPTPSATFPPPPPSSTSSAVVDLTMDSDSDSELEDGRPTKGRKTVGGKTIPYSEHFRPTIGRKTVGGKTIPNNYNFAWRGTPMTKSEAGEQCSKYIH
jgi:hypothetical protein